MQTHLVDQVLSTQIGKMGSFLVICEICTNSTCHNQYDRLIGHIHPVAAANKLTSGIPHERIVWINGQVWFIETRHRHHPLLLLLPDKLPHGVYILGPCRRFESSGLLREFDMRVIGKLLTYQHAYQAPSWHKNL